MAEEDSGRAVGQEKICTGIHKKKREQAVVCSLFRWRCLADSNRRRRFCRPLTKPLIQGTMAVISDLRLQRYNINSYLPKLLSTFFVQNNAFRLFLCFYYCISVLSFLCFYYYKRLLLDSCSNYCQHVLILYICSGLNRQVLQLQLFLQKCSVT